MENTESHWIACPDCKGQGKTRQRIRKKLKLQYQRDLAQFEKSDKQGLPPERPRGQLTPCRNCDGSGVISSASFPTVDQDNYPNIAIVGAGIGGVALAVACLHRGIPFTLYERDVNFEARSQGYGLTLQQASKAIKSLGILSLKEGVVSTRHVVHKVDGEVIGEWGMRKWMESGAKANPRRTNVHIARQSLRLELLNQLGGHDKVHWGHQLIDFQEHESGVDLNFKIDGQVKKAKADILVGADGIRSAVRKQLIGDDKTPLRYLDCIAILGICPLSQLDGVDSSLLDLKTVFQTANGNERIYVMPFSTDSVMWQLSFPMPEEEAKSLAIQGAQALKEEACRRTPWHAPIPQIIKATDEGLISGYPVYDRELISSELLDQGEKTTLIGDAAHPMSPFKGQGANQALLDALVLARGITKGCRPNSDWREVGIRASVLKDFEAEMIERSAVKVKDSADAADFLHSDVVLYEANEPRGRCLKGDKEG